MSPAGASPQALIPLDKDFIAISSFNQTTQLPGNHLVRFTKKLNLPEIISPNSLET